MRSLLRRSIQAIVTSFLLLAGPASAAPAVVGVGELSCSKEIQERVCMRLTERLVTILSASFDRPVVRQSVALEKERACAQDTACLATTRIIYGSLVSGTVRLVGKGAEVSLRLLDAKRMEKQGEGMATAPTPKEESLLLAIEKAAGELPRL